MQIIINVASEQDSRVLAAFGRQQNLRDENNDVRAGRESELKKYFVDHLRNMVTNQETRQAQEAIKIAPILID